MTEGLKWTVNHVARSDDKHLELMSEENVKKANEFHKSFPQYTVTPLQDLAELASYLGVKSIHCKDESYRFGLNAFKVLGGSYAMGRYIAKEVGKDISELPYAVLSSEELRKEFGQATFFTATDGNHGRGVAWAANRLGQKAVVRMPKGTTKTRFDNIAKEGATVTIEEVNYDDCVRMAAAEAAIAKLEAAEADKAAAAKEWLPLKLQRRSMVLSFRILPGTDMKKSRHGSCRDMELWLWKLISSLKKPESIIRHMYLFRQVLVPLPELL